jgi:SAM-dependent methyltransferase
MRMTPSLYTATLNRPVSRLAFFEDICRGKQVLDIGCVQHDAVHATSDTWLHGRLRQVAGQLVGVDYVPDAVASLRERGYDVRLGDVTQPLPLDMQFDVVTIGNLIEHLSNFEGLFHNLQRWLKPGGTVLISTANPFFYNQYFYAVFRNSILVNAEHTCWLDPVTLDQLAQRFGFATEAVAWCTERWRLSDVILHGRDIEYDMFKGRWFFPHPPGAAEQRLAPVVQSLLQRLLPPAKMQKITAQYGAETPRFLWFRLKSLLFEGRWWLQRRLIPVAPINQHELFVSVLRYTPQPAGGH